MSGTALEAALRLASEKSRAGWVEPLTNADYRAALEAAKDTLPEPEPSVIVFQAADGKIILTIHPNGTLERGEQFATDDLASMAMFDCMSRCLPCFLSELRMRAETAEHAFRLLHAKAAENDGTEALRIAQAARNLPSSY